MRHRVQRSLHMGAGMAAHGDPRHHVPASRRRRGLRLVDDVIQLDFVTHPRVLLGIRKQGARQVDDAAVLKRRGWHHEPAAFLRAAAAAAGAS